MSRLVVVAAAALALAGCKSTPENGFAVDVTVTADSSLTDLSQVRTLDVSVSGAETFHTTYAISTQLASREAKFIYRPAVSSGSLTFAIYALDTSGASLAFGQGSATLKSGATTTLTVTLGTANVPSTDMAMCQPACPTVGATQCAGTQVQTCQLIGGCLMWGPAASCGSNMLCCADACIAADVSNCYACGTACSGNTPACLPTPMKCGCTVGVCAATSMGCDTSTGDCVACTALAANSTDFYVDATSFAGGTGNAICPFKTITAALTAANASTAANKTIHIAAGTYDAALGETYPLVLRNGVSLVGAGAANTILSGVSGGTLHSEAGPFGGGGQFPGTYNIGILVGDATGAAITISGLQIKSPTTAAPTANYLGILCDRGTAVQTIANPPQAGYPAANLILSNVTVGPGFDTAIIDTNSTQATPAPSGCNMKVLGSTITGNNRGFWGVGAGLDNSRKGVIAMQIGDDTAANANAFVNNKNPTSPGNGLGVLVWDNVSPIYVNRNTFSGESGVVFDNHSTVSVGTVRNYIEVKDNTFTALTNFGIDLNNSSTIDTLSGNSFSAINAPDSFGFSGVGIVLGAGGTRTHVRKARSNSFVGNDVAIDFRGGTFQTEADSIVDDFGLSAADPGKNDFRCNSRLTGAGAPMVGYDIFINADIAAGVTLIPHFFGNSWDRAPPMLQSTPTAGVNGQDLYRNTVNSPTPDVAGATVSTTTCPAMHTP